MDSSSTNLLREIFIGLLDFEILPNWFENVFDEDDFVGQEPYDLAKKYGFENNIFLINCGSLLINTSAFLIFLPISVIFFLLCCNLKIRNYFLRALQ